jgi:uncharacterized protein (TIGR03437 family)
MSIGGIAVRKTAFALFLVLCASAAAQEILQITTTSVPNGTVGVAYSATINSNANSDLNPMWSVSAGSLPPGLGLTNTTGPSTAIAGTPTTAGPYSFTLKVTQGVATEAFQSATQSYNMTIFTPVAFTSTSPLPNGTVGIPYNYQFNATGGSPPYAFSATGLPPGLSLSGSGALTGTPTTANGYTFSVSVTDHNTTATLSFSITILSPLTLNPASPPDGMVGASYSYQFSASGGTPPYNFTSSGLPPGLSLTTSGDLFGTPTAASGYSFSVTVTDHNGAMASSNFLLAVVPTLTLVTPSPLPLATAGSPYSTPIAASGGMSPYSFAITTQNPPGLSMTASGGLGGTPTAIGTFTFTVQVTDSLQFTATKQYSLTVAAGTPLLTVSPLSLTFTALPNSSVPPQSISIVSTNGNAVAFSMTVDTGAAGSTAPAWIGVSPSGGVTPAVATVSVNPAMLSGSSGTAVIQVSVPGNSSQTPINVTVTLNISSTTPSLTAIPGAVQFAALGDVPGVEQQTVLIENTGGANPGVSIADNSPWVSVQPVPGSPNLFQVQVNTAGLAVGNYHDILQITAGTASLNVPITLFVASSGPILGVGLTGVRFEARQSNVPARPQNIPILNLGDPTSIVNWTAQILSGSNWLTITNSSGQATASAPGTLTLTPGAGAASLPAGPQYAVIKIFDPNSSNSPQYIVAVLDIQPVTAPALPDPSPAGLYFSSTTGAQQVLVYTSSSTPIAYETSVTTSNGSGWLAASPASGVASVASPGQITISVTPPLAPGIYSGSVNIGMNGVVVVVNVTLVVPAGGAASTSAQVHPLATSSCTASRLALTETGLVNNFSVPAGWPSALIVQLNDDCGNAVSNGAVVASFSNGDAPLPLSNALSNTYSATWQPGTVFPEMTVTLNATSPSLAPATQTLTGNVNANATPQPVLLPGGTLQIFFDGAQAAALGNGLAPGTVAQVYGSNLGPTSIVGASTVPLPSTLDGTFMLVGGQMAPLYFVLNNPIAVQIPFEIAANQQAAAIASVNGVPSLPIMLTIVPAQPGIALNPDGSVKAQHLDYSLVTSSSPAKPGETVVIYLAGMGATNPSVASGAATPDQQVPANIPPIVTVGGQKAGIVYAGLTPTGVGLYQIDFTVPSTASSGNLAVVVIQNGVSSNTGTLPVGQ